MIRWFRRRRGAGGFTLIELMIVVGIIGILAAIAIPQFIQYRHRGFRAELMSDLKSAYVAAQAYFSDWPSATVDSLGKLTRSGYQRSPNVSDSVSANMTMSGGTITLRHASLPNGRDAGTVSNLGTITLPAMQ